MKFYFCETCGRRLTDKDLEAGAARNKKLKGVYCATCATGVTTLESLPLTNAQASRIVKEEGGAPSTPSHSPARKMRRTSGRTVQPDRRSKSMDRVPGPASTLRLWPWLGVAAALLITALIAVTGEKGEPVRKQRKQASSPKRATPIAPENPPEGGVPPVGPGGRKSEEPVAAATTPKVTPGEKKADAPSSTTKPDALSSNEPNAPKPPPVPSVRPLVLAATTDASGLVRLSWDRKIPIEVRCVLERCPGSPGKELVASAMKWKKVSDITPGLQSFADKLSRDGTWLYRIGLGTDAESTVWSSVVRVSVSLDQLKETFWPAFLGHVQKNEAEAARQLLDRTREKHTYASAEPDWQDAKRMLVWLTDAEAALPKGAATLRDEKSFTLLTGRGRKMLVGKDAGLMQVSGVRDGKLYIKGKGVEMPFPLRNLHPSTRAELIERGLGSDATGLVCVAFLKALVAAGEGASEPLEQAFKASKTARSAGTRKDELRALGRVLAWSRNRMLAAKWGKMEGFAESKDWKGLRRQLVQFRDQFKGYAEFKAYTEKWTALRARAEREIEKVEGYRFDFETAESFRLFNTKLKITTNQNTELQHRDGRLVMRVKDETRGRPSVSISAQGLTYGSHWELGYRVRMHGKIESRDGVARIPDLGRTVAMIVFKKDDDPYSAFTLITAERHNGIIRCAFHLQRQYVTDHVKHPPSGMFTGMERLGTFSAGLTWARARAKYPWSVSGWYDVKLRVLGANVKGRLNVRVFLEDKLPQSARDHMAACPLELNFLPLPLIELDEIYYRPLPAEPTPAKK